MTYLFCVVNLVRVVLFLAGFRLGFQSVQLSNLDIHIKLSTSANPGPFTSPRFRFLHWTQNEVASEIFLCKSRLLTYPLDVVDHS